MAKLYWGFKKVYDFESMEYKALVRLFVDKETTLAFSKDFLPAVIEGGEVTIDPERKEEGDDIPLPLYWAHIEKAYDFESVEPHEHWEVYTSLEDAIKVSEEVYLSDIVKGEVWPGTQVN